ncbi:TPA: winged helix-turn-helix domain-containing protein [Serratia marcescens]
MNYVINREIVFCPAKRTLSLGNESDISITLSNQATRLLIEFIKGSKIPLAKEVLLKIVWEDYGLTPSNNNLYMAVSEIRKSFVNLGVNDMIISTIPKTGFLFSASVDMLESTPDDNVISKGKNEKFNKKTVIVITSLITFITAISVYVYNQQNSIGNALTNLKTTSAVTHEKCTFYSLDINSEKYLPKIMDILKQKGELECENNKKSIFYQTNNKTYIFAASCNGDKDKLRNCESYRITAGI